MRLTIEEHPERLARFTHLKPGSGFKGKRCGEPCPDSSRTCTREQDHRGPHASHGSFGKLTAVWEGYAHRSAESRATAMEVHRGRSEVRGSQGEKMEGGALEALWGRIVRLLHSPEELAMMALFFGLVLWGLSVAWQIVSQW